MANPVTLQDLLPPITADDVEALLLETLQGVGPIQQIGQGAGQVLATGSPLANYDAILTIGTAGTPGTATFTYSLDGGITTNGPVTIPSNGNYGLTGSGITLTFSGTFASGDKYLFQTVYPPFQATDFQSGSAALTFIKSEGVTEADLVGDAIPNVAGGGFVYYASDKGAPNDWLSLISAQLYNNQRFDPIVMLGVVQLSLSIAASPQTFAAGELVIANSLGSGQGVFQYTNTSGFTINNGTTQSVPVQAVAPGAGYNLANGTVTTIINPRPGMSVVNSAPGVSAVTPSGGATGVVTVTGSPNGNYSVAFRVLSTGALGTATGQISLDGGSNYAAPITLPGSGVYNIPLLNGLALTGLTLHMSGTFTSGDSYAFTAYASWILTGGADIESSTSLRTRDVARWPTLGASQGNPGLAWTLLVQSTPNGGSEVTQVKSIPDLVVGGQLNITVAGAAGPVSNSALVNITAFVKTREPLGTKVVVSNSIVQTLAVVADVYVVAAQLAAAQVAIDSAFAALAANTPIQGVVTYASIVDAIESQSASGVTNVHVTSPAPNVDTQLDASSTVLFDLSGLNYILQ